MGLVRFSQLILNAMTVGCVISLYLHRNRKCSWEKNLLDEKFTIFTYFFGVYFTFHVVTWFIIFSCFFHYFVQVGLKYLFLNSIRRMMFKNLASFLLEFAFGYWAAGEILGGWCDFEHFRECIQNTKVDECDSFLIKRIARFVQGICEYWTYDYDDKIDIFYRNSENICVFAFGYVGHLIMTLISFLFALLLYSILC